MLGRRSIPQRGIDDRVRAAVADGSNLTVSTPLGDIDVVQRLPGVPVFAELDADAWDVTLFDVRFRAARVPISSR